MSMLNVRLNEEDEKKLLQVLAAIKADNKSELIKRLINDQWLALQAGRTFVERRGGHPEYLITNKTNLSIRENRKKKFAQYLESKKTKRKI
jgi:lysozyme family protein